MSTERMIGAVAAVIAVVAAFWFVALSPKLSQNSDLQSQVSSLDAAVAQAEQAAAQGSQLKRSYGANYASLVRLGKAVPADSDTPSLLVQVAGISNHAGAQLDGLTLSSDSGAAAPAPVAPPTTTAPTAAPATETVAALMPLGSSIGPAGLSVMPYDVNFHGDYFQTAKLIGGLDSLVRLRKSKDTSEFSNPLASGRLVTINSFSLTTQDTQAKATDALTGTLSMTTYLAPPDQGLTGGATSTSPVPPGATPSTDTTSSPSVTATVRP